MSWQVIAAIEPSLDGGAQFRRALPQQVFIPKWALAIMASVIMAGGSCWGSPMDITNGLPGAIPSTGRQKPRKDRQSVQALVEHGVTFRF